MRILIVGAGSIGTRHLKNLLKLGYKDLAVCDPDGKKLKAISELGDIGLFKDLKTALKTRQPDVVFICNPTHIHVSTASLALDAGADILIEKPLSTALEGIDALVEKTKKKERIAMVACNYRFHPGYEFLADIVKNGNFGKPLSARIVIGHDLANSRPGADYKNTYAADAQKGGGVILDSGSHAVDYIVPLLGKAELRSSFYGNVSNLEIKAEDYALLSLAHSSGAVSSIELDYFSKPKRHSVELQFEKGRAKWDFAGNFIELQKADSKDYQKKQLYEGASPEEARNDMYLKELQHFLEAVKNRKAPIQNLMDAKGVLNLLLEAKK